MLVLLFGVSCVGKTSLIQNLKNNFGWLSIHTYMTREIRLGETEKISVTNDDFIQMDIQKYFMCTNEIFGNKYGTPKNEIEIAVKDNNRYWILDFPISRRHIFQGYNYIPVIVLASNKEQLIDQINKSNRSDRLTHILKEYDDHYVIYNDFLHNKGRNIVIINSPEMLEKTSQQIYDKVIGYHEYSE
jgi:guanylate kinase